MSAAALNRIDWSVPQPSYEDLHAQLDAIQTERNAAVAEAKLWKARYFDTLQELRDAQANYAACDLSHAQWEAAHAELLREFRRLELKLHDALWQRDGSDDMLRHYRHIVGMIAKGEWHIPIEQELYAP